MPTRALLRAILDQYTLTLEGRHGVIHWARVLENGLRLAESTGADPAVVRLFAVFHDACRTGEGRDFTHGPLGAGLAEKLRGQYFDLDDHAFALLTAACHGHTERHLDPDPTIQTCWDADRLDLLRVGIQPAPYYLGTAAARAPDTLVWANQRSSTGHVPELIFLDWGLTLRTRHPEAPGGL